MPYDIFKLKKGQYEVVNTDTGEVHAKQTTLAKAKAQVRLLGMKHATGGLINPNFNDDQMEGNGYYKMKDGCSLYTGGSHASDVDPINYNSELKNNSWLGYGYGGRGHVLPVNYNSEMTSLFNNF